MSTKKKAASKAKKPLSKPRRIDLHHHIVPPSYIKSVGPQRDFVGTWTPALALEDMDKGGTETAITCIYSGGALAGHANARGIARDCNEYAAQMHRDYPTRFGLFATLPMPDVEGSLEEAEYALDVLKADGIYLQTSYGSQWLGDKAFAPFWEEMNRRKAAVFMHPHAPDCCAGLIPGIPPSAIEYPADTTRTIASLLFSGTAGRCPNVRFIFSHGGGTLPFLIERFTRLAQRKDHKVTLPKGPLPQIRRFYYELAQASHPFAVSSIRNLIPLSQLLFGTDYPYRTTVDIARGLGKCGFTARELDAVNRGNALRLFPRFQS
jgi:predicted TIM-barrel fold metal-dependent hydrolase